MEVELANTIIQVLSERERRSSASKPGPSMQSIRDTLKDIFRHRFL